MRLIAGIIAGCVAASVACSDNNTRTANDNRRSDNAVREEMTLTGCLQGGGGTFSNGYLLTMLNDPAGVGTSGSVTSSGSSVEREQMRIAAQTYRLDPDDDVDLDRMVGKQVRVDGRVSEEANVPNGKGGIGSNLDTQRPNRDAFDQERKGPQLRMGDLATFEVTSASIVADSCESAGVWSGRGPAIREDPERPRNKVGETMPKERMSPEQGPRRPIER